MARSLATARTLATGVPSVTARTPAKARTSAATAETPSAEEMTTTAMMGGLKQQSRYIVFVEYSFRILSCMK